MPEHEPLIDTNRVPDIFEACLWRDSDDGEPVAAEGIGRAEFASARLAEHRKEVFGYLAGLPSEFKRSGGGGYSFLNGCQDANDVQWTGFQRTVEQLFLLGMAMGAVALVVPREMWAVLPGGMPYYVVNDDLFVEASS